MEEIKIDRILIEDYGTPNSRSVYCGEIDVGQTIKSNIDLWKEKYFEERDRNIELATTIDSLQTDLRERDNIINNMAEHFYDLYRNSEMIRDSFDLPFGKFLEGKEEIIEYFYKK